MGTWYSKTESIQPVKMKQMFMENENKTCNIDGGYLYKKSLKINGMY